MDGCYFGTTIEMEIVVVDFVKRSEEVLILIRASIAELRADQPLACRLARATFQSRESKKDLKMSHHFDSILKVVQTKQN